MDVMKVLVNQCVLEIVLKKQKNINAGEDKKKYKKTKSAPPLGS